MTDAAWVAPFVRCLGVRMDGEAMDEVDSSGNQITGDTLTLLFNAHYEEIPFQLPVEASGMCWERIVDTHDPALPAARFPSGAPYPLKGRSIAVLRRRPEAPP
jgi:glycogen operon protein